MTILRRIAYGVLGIALTHLVFGAIVRITGSGMGCGDHWPKCYGHWFPPMDRMDLVIEVMHRYLASVLLLALLVLVVAALLRRTEAGVGGRGGVLRPALLALALGLFAAGLGYVTVKLGNSPPATVGHWTVAMALIATVTAVVIRAGGFGGAEARLGGASAKTRRGTLVAAVLALAAVVLGGLTAKVEGGSVACLSFPLCGANPAVPTSAVHVQGTHRVLAVLLVLHLVGLFFALRKRGETPVVRRAAAIALGLGVVQWLVAGAMIGMRLPPVLRSLHEATGVSIWVACFALAYLARFASRDADGAPARGAAAPRGGAPRDVDVTVARASDAVRLPVGAGPVLAAGVRTAAARRTPAGAGMAIARATEPVPMTMQAAEAPSAAVAGRTVATPSRTAAIEPARDRAGEPAELPAALEHAMRAVKASAIAVHQLAAAAAVQAAAATLSPAPGDLVAAAPAGAAPLRSASMRHSVAVIVARGADF